MGAFSREIRAVSNFCSHLHIALAFNFTNTEGIPNPNTSSTQIAGLFIQWFEVLASITDYVAGGSEFTGMFTFLQPIWNQTQTHAPNIEGCSTSPVGWSARSQSLFRTNQCIMNYTLVVDYKFSAHFQIWCMIGVHKKSPSTGVVLIGYCIPHQWLVSPMIVWNRVAWFVVILPRADLNTVLFNTLSYTYARTHIYYRCEIHTLWFCYLYSRLEYIFSNLLCQLQSSYATKFASQSFSLDWCLMFIH